MSHCCSSQGSAGHSSTLQHKWFAQSSSKPLCAMLSKAQACVGLRHICSQVPHGGNSNRLGMCWKMYVRACISGWPFVQLLPSPPLPCHIVSCYSALCCAVLCVTEAPKFSSRKTKADLEGLTDEQQVGVLACTVLDNAATELVYLVQTLRFEFCFGNGQKSCAGMRPLHLVQLVCWHAPTVPFASCVLACAY